MIWKFDFDGIQVSDPADWDAAELSVKYNSIVAGYVVEFGRPLTFTGDAYDTLWAARQSNPCGKIVVTIEYKTDPYASYAAFFTGTIFIADCIFRFDKCSAEADLIDAGYSASIFRNAKIKAHLDVEFSKSGDTITPPTNRELNFFTCSTGGYGTLDVEGYTVFDALTYLVDFVTDGAITVSAPIYDTGGDYAGLCITTPEAIRNHAGTGNAPYISLGDLLDALRKIHNVVTWVDQGVSPAVFNIGPQPVVRDTSFGESYTNVTGYTLRTDTESIYQLVRIGSNQTQESEGGTFKFPDIVYLSHKDQEFHFLGGCNSDQVLDLVVDCIIDSNVIQDINENASEEYDGGWVMVEATLATGNCVAYDIFDPAGSVRIYNLNLTSKYRLESGYWLGYLPNGLAQFLGDNNDGFRAQFTSPISASGAGNILPLQKLPYPDDSTGPNNDPNGNWDAATNYRYTCPAAGLFGFNVGFTMQNIDVGGIGNTVDITIEVRRYDSGAALLETRTFTDEINAATGLAYNYDFYPTNFYCSVNDYIEVWFSAVASVTIAPSPSYDLDDDNYFRSTYTNVGGGEVADFDPRDFVGAVFEFEDVAILSEISSFMRKPIWTLSSHPSDASAGFWDGNIDDLTINPQTGRTKFVIKGRLS